MRSVLCVIIAATLLAAACSGGDPDPAIAAATPPPSESTPTPSDASPAPTPTAPVADAVVVEIEPRSVVYGGVVFAPVLAEISNEDPTSRENGLGLPSTETYLHVTVQVRNPMNQATLTLDDRRFFSLRVAGVDTAAPLLSDDIAPRSAIRPGVEGSLRVSWEVADDFELVDGTLVVGPAETRQALLPLTGFVLATASRLQAIPVDLTGPVDGPTVCGPTRLQVGQPLVTSSIDLPADVADTGGLPRRAFVGQTFVEVTVDLSVVAVEGAEECTGTIVSTDLIEITSDGNRAPDGWSEGPSAIPAEVGDTVTLTVGTMVRIGAQVQITVGEPGGNTLTTAFPAG